MTGNQFRKMALALPGAIEGAHMGHPDFRAHGRIFASLKHGERQAAVVITPDQRRDVLERGAPAFEPESGAWGRQGCTRIELASADHELVGEALTLAWQLSEAKGAKRPAARRSTSSGPAARRAAVRTRPRSRR